MESQAEEKLCSALEKMEQALSRIEAQYEAMSSRIDRIVAAVESQGGEEVKAEQEKPGRKTVPPVIASLLAKNGVEISSFGEERVEKALSGLSVEQRIAVKAELARAGVLQ